jgi:hypothetical protein
LATTHNLLASIPGLYIQSKKANSNTLYINEKHEHMEANNFFNNLESLLKNPDINTEQAVSLGKILVQAALHAGNTGDEN